MQSPQDEPEFTRWNKRYDTPDYLFGTAPSTLLSDHAQLFTPGASALLPADGEGRNGVYLASLGLNVTTFDIAPNATAKARKLAAAQGVTLDIREGSVTSWNWTERHYDYVIGVFFQFVAPQARRQIFAGIAAALNPGGLVLLRGYTPKQLDYRTGGPSEVENLYTAEMLAASFPGFAILHSELRETILSEGTRHTGMSAFIDFIARKPEQSL